MVRIPLPTSSADAIRLAQRFLSHLYAAAFHASSRIHLFRASLAENRVVIAAFDCEKEHLNRVIIA
jgi:hypothetical protein